MNGADPSCLQAQEELAAQRLTPFTDVCYCALRTIVPYNAFSEDSVVTSFIYHGLNGEAYRFSAIDISNQRALPICGGLIVVAKEGEAPVYIGYASSIRERMIVANLWNDARHGHGASQIYVLPSGNMSWGEKAANNLRARYKPAMNE